MKRKLFRASVKPRSSLRILRIVCGVALCAAVWLVTSVLPAAADDSVSVRLWGSTGTESVQLLVDGRQVASRTLSTNSQTWTVSTNVSNTVEVKFVNDGNDNGRDRNVYVNWVDVNGTRIEGEDPSVYSTGTWQRSTGCAPGYKQSEALHCNGSLTFTFDDDGGGNCDWITPTFTSNETAFGSSDRWIVRSQPRADDCTATEMRVTANERLLVKARQGNWYYVQQVNEDYRAGWVYKDGVAFELPFSEGTGTDSNPISSITNVSTHASHTWANAAFDRFGFDVRVAEMDAADRGYFVASQFGWSNGDGGYAGIQGDVSGPIGRGAIFSIFTDALGARAPSNGEVVDDCEVMQPGGPCIGFWSVRVPYDWQIGDRYRVEVRTAETSGSSKWMEAYVIDARGTETLIGGIRVPQTIGTLNPWTFWLERYTNPLGSIGCAGPQRFTVDITNVRGVRNGVESRPTAARWTTNLVAACPGLQQTSGILGGVRHSIGS